ncbi:MAG: hypothetical protein LBU32_23230 [Clostridiales bacterium]|nr:hypothetical protein [Clostridiales bacterium]
MRVRPESERVNYIEDRKVWSILEIYSLKTGQREVLSVFKDLIEAPNWTKDGKSLVYNMNGHIWLWDLEKAQAELVETGAADQCNNDHVLSSDGAGLAVSHGTWEDGLSRIYTLPLSGGCPSLITPIGPSYLHGWSPDGATLAYCAERNGQYDIYSVPAIGGREKRLTDSPSLDDGPEYSPCGRFIWFNSARSGLMQIWRMEFDGSNLKQMTFDESNSWFPHISPDGGQVVYISYNKGDVAPESHPPNKNVEIRLMPSSGGEFKTLFSLFGGQGTMNVNSWSPDSSKFAFVSYKPINGADY